ncbi:type II secretion system protein GspG [Desulfovibrio mangrovi]|uniref:type II secretion system protein GspG n=1 Tax=Desulfovibrio mangrovi TaxID=2976983 RepID=UPI002247CBE6|nr:type II secretion system protein GspG [Desulfovibrio mangrovi]UZP67808.1 type II secretion system protein GspG [Desulfovibrio mangrovi]
MKRRFPVSAGEAFAAVLCFLLVALGVRYRMDSPAGGHDQSLKVQLLTVARAVEFFRADCGRLPAESEGLAVLLPSDWKGDAEAGWQAGIQGDRPECAREEGYLPLSLAAEEGGERFILADPWGHPLVLRYPEEGGPFAVVSLGADGLPGGGGRNQDISSLDMQP